VRVEWLRSALANLNAEAEYISQDSLAAAAHMVTRIIKAVDNLQRFPGAGRAGSVSGTRELVVSGTPYSIPYRVRGDAVVLLRVFHAARKRPNRL
jgi:toxin ParE1/3/4